MLTSKSGLLIINNAIMFRSENIAVMVRLLSSRYGFCFWKGANNDE